MKILTRPHAVVEQSSINKEIQNHVYTVLNGELNVRFKLKNHVKIGNV